MPTPDDLPRNIALIGFMGSGKTTVGRALAERLRWRFVDTDARISESADGRSVASLFADEGESSFRRREADAVRAVCSGRDQVIATGGGAVMSPENAAALREAALVVCLTARPDVVVARTRQTLRPPARSSLQRSPKTGEEGLLARVLACWANARPSIMRRPT